LSDEVLARLSVWSKKTKPKPKPKPTLILKNCSVHVRITVHNYHTQQNTEQF